MTNRVLLNNIEHKDLRVVSRYGPAYGDAVNQMAVFPTEFEELQREFVILFRKDREGTYQAIILLGFDKDENLFLAEDRWTSRYVPAIQQRGPFSISIERREIQGGEEGEPMIHVDLDDPRVVKEEGLPLFREHGGNSPYLDHVAAVLRTIHIGVEAAKLMYATFEKLALIEPTRLEVSVSDEKKYLLSEFSTISAQRLAVLDGPSLEGLNRAGFLAPAIFVASSLGNMQRLIELKNRREQA